MMMSSAETQMFTFSPISLTQNRTIMFRYTTLSFLILLLLSGCDSTSTNTDDNDDEIDIVNALTECTDGMADEYPCNNIGLYANLSIQELLAETTGTNDNPPELNDIWGWIDPQTQKEYALVGLTDGVSVVEVTNPLEPVVIAKLLEPNTVQKLVTQPGILQSHDDEHDGFKEASSWRDIKVYRNTMYVVSEQQSYGLQVFDLTRLRDVTDPPVFLSEDTRYTEFGNAHNLAINEDTGFAYIVGITSGTVCSEQGGLHIVDINDPLNPQYAGCYFDEQTGGRTRNGYIHDTQCVIYEGADDQYTGNEICFSSSENSLLITDVNEKLLASTISITFYEGNTYSHQGWLTEDQRYFMMNDELDERNNQHTTRTYIWNVEDLDNPVLTGYYDHGTTSIDHNLYIVDDMMYQANYTSGFRVLDVSNPTPDGIVEMGFFDTTPGPDNMDFGGLWSVYPWLSGDKVIVSDIENGLFILQVQR